MRLAHCQSIVAHDNDPANGTFIAEDPLGLAADDSNLYRYVLNDPLNATDPTGECPLVLVGVCAMGGCEVAVTATAALFASAAGALCGLTGCFDTFFADHTRNIQDKNWDKHSKKRPGDWEKGDENRRRPRKRPQDRKGPWPPKPEPQPQPKPKPPLPK
jgi:uncharacterized protein RhaS with RHS repeats